MDKLPTIAEIMQYNKEREYYKLSLYLREIIRKDLLRQIFENPDSKIETITVRLPFYDDYNECFKIYKDKLPEYTKENDNIVFQINNEIICKYLLFGCYYFPTPMYREIIYEKKYLKAIHEYIRKQILLNSKIVFDIADFYETDVDGRFNSTMHLFWDFIFDEIKKKYEHDTRISNIIKTRTGFQFDYSGSNYFDIN